MHSARLDGPDDFRGWRESARGLLEAGVHPDDVDWSCDGAPSLFASAPTPPRAASTSVNVPRSFLKLAAAASLHRDASKFALLYRLLWRLRTEPRLLDLATDTDVARAHSLARAVKREIHKMHAFIRFREVVHEGALRYVAWFEPEHHVLAAAAPFFVRRFANMRWSILTPERSAHWDLEALTFGRGAHRTDAPAEDAQEALWRTYYASIFNPARLNAATMRAHMPKRYWRNLPESTAIPQLIASAQERTLAMIHKAPTESPRIKARAPVRTRQHALAPTTSGSLAELREEARGCRACPLWKNATQTVFGEGRRSASILFVGEQPGDQEDLAGRPFVGPAGRLLDKALAEAGIDRKATYVTNAVKHFKFEPRGKRRIHKKPNEMEIAACHQWLEGELREVDPQVVVALGATAARAVFGRATAIGKNRGRVIPAQEAQTFTNADVLVTVHPSYLLRVPDEDRHAAYAEFVADLKLLARYA
jgi:DNA polymerase